MHYDVDFLVVENFAHKLFVFEVSAVEFYRRQQSPLVSVDKVVENHGFVPRGYELSYAVASDVARASDYQYIHDCDSIG